VLNDRALPVNGRDAMPTPGGGQGTTTARASATGDGGSNSASVSLEAELEYWKEIKDSTEADDFETFLRVFPGSRFAPLARRRMDRLEADAKAGREANEQGQKEPAEGARVETEQAAVAGAAEEEAGSAYLERQRIDAREPKLMLPEGEADDVAAAMDLSPSMMVQPAFDTVDIPHFMAVTGPVHARRRAAKPPHTQSVREPPHPFDSSASRNPPWLPIALALAAALVGSGLWYAARPEFGPIVTMLRMQAQTVLAQLGQEGQAREAEQTEQQRAGGETARLADDQRKNEGALEAEHDRQLALARQKEEAKAAAIRNHEHAMSLLNQGRSSEAVRLLRQLAKSGYGPAAKTLGDLYSSGEEVLLDMQEAAYFYAIAESNGVRIDRPAFVHR